MDTCKRGHDPSEWSLDARGWRSCRACRRERKRTAYVPKERPTSYTRRDRLELLMRHVEVTPDHWLWSGATSNGYGRFQLESYGRPVGAHRAAWELIVGPIPDGMTIDHKCLTPLCVNPDHLQLATPARNSELVGERRDACRNGHPRIPEFMRVSVTKEGWTRRRCLVCEGYGAAVALWQAGKFGDDGDGDYNGINTNTTKENNDGKHNDGRLR